MDRGAVDCDFVRSRYPFWLEDRDAQGQIILLANKALGGAESFSKDCRHLRPTNALARGSHESVILRVRRSFGGTGVPSNDRLRRKSPTGMASPRSGEVHFRQAVASFQVRDLRHIMILHDHRHATGKQHIYLASQHSNMSLTQSTSH